MQSDGRLSIVHEEGSLAPFKTVATFEIGQSAYFRKYRSCNGFTPMHKSITDEKATTSAKSSGLVA